MTPASLDDPRGAGNDNREGVDDDARVAELLGRTPAGAFEVVVRAADGAPAVIANAPFLHDGTPMPTRYWLVDPALREAVAAIESSGGVRQAEAVIPAAELADAHARYAAERDALDSRRPSRPEAIGRRRGYPAGGQVPPCPPGLVVRPGPTTRWGTGRPCASVSTHPDGVVARPGGLQWAGGGDRLRNQLDPTVGGRRARSPARAIDADHPAG